MEPIKKVLVGVDASTTDTTVIEFAQFVVDSSSAEQIIFVNIVKNLNIPEEVVKEFPDMVDNAIKDREQQIKKAVEKDFNPKREVETSFIIESGQSTKAVLNIANKENIDLIVIGKKISSPGSGVLAQRLARRSSCNLLIVPEGTKPKAGKVLIPVDYSFHSKIALEQAIDMAVKYSPDMQIICQNVYNVPTGYHYSGKSYKEFAAIMKKNSERDFKRFIKNIDTRNINVVPRYSLDTNEDITTDIYDAAKDEKADIIVIGAKGLTATTAIFLGSWAEKIVNINHEYPLLVVRKKGQNAGFIDYIKSIAK
ncbi:MAG: universal stress protein [Bacteroidota bacterium]